MENSFKGKQLSSLNKRGKAEREVMDKEVQERKLNRKRELNGIAREEDRSLETVKIENKNRIRIFLRSIEGGEKGKSKKNVMEKRERKN